MNNWKILSAYLANFWKHYITNVFMFLTPFLAPAFFPPGTSFMDSMIYMYILLPLGRMIRPVGIIFFSYLENRYGKSTVVRVSLCGLALMSFCLAFCPTYKHVGLLAPLLLLLGKICMNFFASGGSIGIILSIFEKTKEQSQSRHSSFYQITTVSGVIGAAVGVFCLSSFGLIADYWRLLYVIGTVIGVHAAFIPQILQKTENKNFFSLGFKKVFEHRKVLLAIMLVIGFSYANYYMVIWTLSGFVPQVAACSQHKMLLMNVFLLSIDACVLFFCAKYLSNIYKEKFMMMSALLISLLVIPLCGYIKYMSPIAIFATLSLFIILGSFYVAPMYAWAANLIPAKERYMIVALGSCLGPLFFGAPATAISLSLYKHFSYPSSIAWYWSFLALVAFCSVRVVSKVGLFPAKKSREALPLGT